MGSVGRIEGAELVCDGCDNLGGVVAVGNGSGTEEARPQDALCMAPLCDSVGDSGLAGASQAVQPEYSRVLGSRVDRMVGSVLKRSSVKRPSGDLVQYSGACRVEAWRAVWGTVVSSLGSNVRWYSVTWVQIVRTTLPPEIRFGPTLRNHLHRALATTAINH